MHSQALVTNDLAHWARHALPGEADTTPAVSPAGRYAAWQAGGRGGYVEWPSTAGFLRPAVTKYDSDAGSTTLVIDDGGTVDQLGPEFGPDGSCRFGVHRRTLAGATCHQVVAGVEPGCTDSEVDGLDALTVVGDGCSGLRSATYVVSRPDPASPWQLTRTAPDHAPGLVDVQSSPSRVVPTSFRDVTGQPLGRVPQSMAAPAPPQPHADIVADASSTPRIRARRRLVSPRLDRRGHPPAIAGHALVAFASTHRRHLTIQVYDDLAQTWGPQRQVSDAGGPWHHAGRVSMPPAGRCRKVTVDLPLVPTEVVLRGTHGRYRVLRRADYLG